MQFSDPNEQAGISLMSPYTGPSSGRRRPSGGLIGAILILIIVGGGLGFFYWHAHSSVTLSVGTLPTIQSASGCLGAVVVQTGPANQVTLAGNIPSYTQNSATNTIELGDDCQNVTITVPPAANLDLWASDSLTVHGVSGTLNVSTSNGGLIDLEQVTLEGQSKIDADDTGGTSIDTYGGPIILNGSLAPGSATTMNDYSDTIKITLSSETSCQLDISNGASQITSNVPGVQMPADSASDLQANIGSNPSAAKLTIDAFETAITLHKEP